MKKVFMFLAASVVVLGISSQIASAQEEDAAATEATEEISEATEEVAETTDAVDPFAAGKSEEPLHQQLKTKFIEGGAGFMSLVIICLILGLAVAIERIIYLALCKTNTKKLLAAVEAALQNGGVEAAKNVCRDTKGPVASIFYQGLLRADQGMDVVEKTIVSYGSVQMSNMEKGLSWLGLFIAIAPSLGFLGTVIGMIAAFDAIAIAGDISPNIVAGGMKVALITTVGGLIVAIILQLFYNYILSQIDAHGIDMSKANLKLVELLNENEKNN